MASTSQICSLKVLLLVLPGLALSLSVKRLDEMQDALQQIVPPMAFAAVPVEAPAVDPAGTLQLSAIAPPAMAAPATYSQQPIIPQASAMLLQPSINPEMQAPETFLQQLTNQQSPTKLLQQTINPDALLPLNVMSTRIAPGSLQSSADQSLVTLSSNGSPDLQAPQVSTLAQLQAPQVSTLAQLGGSSGLTTENTALKQEVSQLQEQLANATALNKGLETELAKTREEAVKAASKESAKEAEADRAIQTANLMVAQVQVAQEKLRKTEDVIRSLVPTLKKGVSLR